MLQVRTGPGSFISTMGSGGEINVNLTNVGRYKVRKNVGVERDGGGLRNINVTNLDKPLLLMKAP